MNKYIVLLIIYQDTMGKKNIGRTTLRDFKLEIKEKEKAGEEKEKRAVLKIPNQTIKQK